MVEISARVASRRHVARHTLRRLDERASAASRAVQPQQLLASALATSLALSGMINTPAIAAEAPMQAVQGFEEFAAKGGKMKADPNCFFNECAFALITVEPLQDRASPASFRFPN
eukprot:scaffold11901_cov96-Isochrysis_galbana.AAC.3